MAFVRAVFVFGPGITLQSSCWQNLLDYVLSESLYLTQRLIRMSLAFQGLCFLSVSVRQVCR